MSDDIKIKRTAPDGLLIHSWNPVKPDPWASPAVPA